MIKTCELQTCDGLNTVELKDVLYSPDTETIKRVSGETILKLPFDINAISKRLNYLENLVHNITDESVETQFEEIEKELNAIRDWINQVETDFQNIDKEFLKVKDTINSVDSNSLDKNTFDKFKKDFDTWKSNIEGKVNNNTANISTLQNKVKTNEDNIASLKEDNSKFNTEYPKLLDIEKYLSNEKELETDLTWKNKNGKTQLTFKSDTNYGSDYGYLKYVSDNNDYAFWGDSNENSSIILGVENDGKTSVSDVVALKSSSAVIVDSSDLIFKNGTNHFSIIDKLGLKEPDFNSGWVSVTRDNGLKINNPLGQNAFFMGYIKYNNGDIMQFGVYSGYDDDDNVDGGDTGVYLVVQSSKLIIAVRKKNNNGTPSAVGLSDGITYSTKVQNTFDAKIIGWKLKSGVVI